ncbi:discoidin domain-containing protein [Polaribacter haliotis]|uniref:Discoidin domain-containing protein n=3 Tax=Polaribacter haliotis TaxID=1888915 RepID=A0A7L8AG26_9FLAO|nr:discoidin domain-containing protein [Polaribacter haliotis]QOD60894.1 discoidin domain-containing protein [Polaribacter haliotis]
MFLFNFQSFSQTITGTGSRTTTCGTCTPVGWFNTGGSPDVSNRNNAGGQGTQGGNASWINAPLPLPPTGDVTWITMRDVGNLNTLPEESVTTNMGGLVNGKLYKLSVYHMTSISNTNGVGGDPYSRKYIDAFDYQIDGNARQKIPVISSAHENWVEKAYIFKAEPNASGEMTLTFYPLDNVVNPFDGDGNATFDNVESIHIAVELNAVEELDSDGDGVPDTIDIDDDNDGILDTVESTVNGTVYNPLGDEDGDLLPNYLDTRDDGTGDGSTTNYNDINGDGVADIFDFDNDGVPNHLDLDADGDGIPDIIEGQPTGTYKAFTGNVGANGLDSAFENNDSPTATSYPLINTENVGNPDYLDLDSDGDGQSDEEEANITLTGDVGVNGLDNSYDIADDYTDPNGIFDNSQSDNFPDSTNGGDVDWRDASTSKDTDGDGVADAIDIDDDNDGIPDTVECPSVAGSNATGVQSSTSVTNPTNAIGSNDARATLNDIADVLVIDLGKVVAKNAIIEIESRVTSNINHFMSVDQSLTAATSSYTNAKSYSWTTVNTDENKQYKLTSAARYIRIKLAVDGGGSLQIDNVLYKSFQPICDSDGDGIPNIRDLDSDNDGIPDNIEAQSSFNYKAPDSNGTTDSDGDGLNDAYDTDCVGGLFSCGGVTGVSLAVPNNHDGTDTPDYLDTDSDNDGTTDRIEAGLSLSGVVGVNGLDNNYDNGDNYTDVNGSFDNSPYGEIPNTNGTDSPDDVDFRDTITVFLDTDNDGVPDSVDIDDDNDGILDTEEDGNCTGSTTVSTYNFTSRASANNNWNFSDPRGTGLQVNNTGGRWSWHNGSTSSSNVGPDGGQSGGTDGYAYTEMSNPGANEDKFEVELKSTFDASNHSIIFSYYFGYRGDGNNGTIQLQSSDNGILWVNRGNAEQLDQQGIAQNGTFTWIKKTVDLSGLISGSATRFKLVITQGNNGTSWHKDVGLDSVTVSLCNIDADGDGISNSRDLDSDNDGIPDIIEAQSTKDYTKPLGLDSDNDGLDDAYDTTPNGDSAGTGSLGLTPVNTDSTDNPDYKDLDADNDGIFDVNESGSELPNDGSGKVSGAVGINGLVNALDNGDNYADVNGSFDDTQTDNFTDVDDDANFGGDVDYRDTTFDLDTDKDGVPDDTDLDDDNDGILDSEETGVCGTDNTVASVTGFEGILFDMPDQDTWSFINASNQFPDFNQTQIATFDYVEYKNTDNAFNVRFANSPVNLSGYSKATNYNGSNVPNGSEDAAILFTKTITTVEAGVYQIDLGYGDDHIVVYHNGNKVYSIQNAYNSTTNNNAVSISSVIPSITLNTGDVLQYLLIEEHTGNTNIDIYGTKLTEIGGGEKRCVIDTDGDGIPNHLDLDSDNDGIPDVIEAGGTDTNRDGMADDDDDNADNTATNGIPTSAGSGQTPRNTDTDGIPDYLDIDADNDGIPDNIEGQPSNNYKEPSGIATGITDVNNNGVDDTYEIGAIIGLEATNTDNTDTPDYIDLDADNDGIPDIQENGDTDNVASGNDADNDGLDDAFDDNNDSSILGSTVNDGLGANDKVTNEATLETAYGDSDNDFPLPETGDLDYRDATDTDNDGIPDNVDLDDDNDGIPDNLECTTPIVSTFNGGTATQSSSLNNGNCPSNSCSANLARDGNTSGDFGNGSVTHTNTQKDPWWLLDMGFVTTIDNVVLYNRTNCCGDRLDGFILEVLDNNDNVVYTHNNVVASATNTISGINTLGKKIRIRLEGDGRILSLAEVVVQVSDCNGTDTDGDGIPNHLDLDSDNDGIPDLVEAGGEDTDGNGKIDDINADGTLVNDFDNDGLDDRYDVDVTGGTDGNAITNPDSDGDGIPDSLDLDSDNDGIPDVVEAGGTDSNGDGKADGFVDTDKDGFNDLVDGDVGQDGTSENTANALIVTGDDADDDGKPDSYPNGDTDKDGFPDFIDLDADNDGIPDLVEAGGIDTNGDGLVDDTTDIDQDGLADIYDENATDGPGPDGTNGIALVETDASGNMLDGDGNSIDTDGDGLPNHLDLDADNDGIPDLVEAGGVDTNGDGLVDDTTDADNDGFADVYDTDDDGTPGVEDATDALLQTAGTDTDGDGKADDVAIVFENGEGVNADTDGDGFPNHLDLDADNDGIPDLVEAGGVDTNGDGLVDDTTDADNDGFADVYDTDDDGTPGVEDATDALLQTAGTDTDGDGKADDVAIVFENGEGVNADTDGDGFPNHLDLDADNDGIPDLVEAGGVDTNGDGLVDNTTDADNDGFADVYDTDDDGTLGVEDATDALLQTAGTDTDGDGKADDAAITFVNGEGANADTDGDGFPNHLDLDADNDGIPDLVEAGGVDTNGDGLVDNTTDADKDGLADVYDTDDDGTPGVEDATDALLQTGGTDTDGDGKADDAAITFVNGEGANADTDGDGFPNHLDLDADNDGIPDLVEAGGVDTNGDGLVDNTTDADNDGFADVYDTDDDGTLGVEDATDALLQTAGTDTDGDGKADDVAIVFENGEGVNADTDGDGFPNHLDLDADNDGIPDLVEAGGVDTNGDGLVDNTTDADNDGFADVYDTDDDGTLGVEDATDALLQTAGTDTDGDGKADDVAIVFENGEGVNADTDGDGFPNHLDLDADNDGIPDLVEAGGVDTNGDGLVDNTTDADKDGLADVYDTDDDGTPGVEDATDALLQTGGTDTDGDGKADDAAITFVNGEGANADTDGDGFPNHLDLDADNDGIPDLVEAGGVDTNGDGLVDNTTDADKDGFADVYDTDDDGTPGVEDANDALLQTGGTDTDGDGKADDVAITFVNGEGANADIDGDGFPNHLDLDADNDGIPDLVEAGGVDTNGDGLVDNTTDADKDGFADIYDTDDDGTPGVEDATDALLQTGGTDTDGDGKADDVAITFVNGEGANADIDGDGFPNHLDLDADNDGIPDLVEAGGVDTNGDGLVDNTTDADKDGFADIYDTDDDGTLGVEDANDALLQTGGTDTDGDGKADDLAIVFENGEGVNADTDGDGFPNHLDLDADNDGIPDLVEAGGVDTNGDGLVDNTTDADNDGFADVYDTDDDGTPGVEDANDALLQTGGTDTDGDGKADDVAIVFENGDNVNADTDGDGLPNYLDLDADNDGIPDVVEAGGTDVNGDGRSDNFNDTDNDGFNDDVDGDVGQDGTSENIANVLIVTGSDTGSDGKVDTYLNGDTDGDGVLDYLDLDSDNDGITDVIEAGGADTNRDGKQDGFIDNDNDGFNDTVDGDPNNALANGTDTVGTNTTNALIVTGADGDGDGKPDSYPNGNLDGDKKLNHLDIDADNDGIPDNIEAQSSSGYIAPSDVGTAMTDTNNNGVDDVYEVGGIGLVPENTDISNDTIPDYLDLDSDNDGIQDIYENGDLENEVSGTDLDNDGLDDNFDDNNDSGIAGSTVNDGLGIGDKVTNITNLEAAYGDKDNDFNPGTGDLDYRDIDPIGTAMITQVYTFNDERWIEITNISETEKVPANYLKVQLYSNRTGDQTNVPPTTSVILTTELDPGKSVLYKNNVTNITNIDNTAKVYTNTVLTNLVGENDIITLSTTDDNTSWANKYDIISSIKDKTSYVRIDETLVPNPIYTESEWVVFIDDALDPYKLLGAGGAERHPHDPLISEIASSNAQANTRLGLHRIDITERTLGAWDNGYPDRSRFVVINEDYNHTSGKLSARKLKVNASTKLSITDNLVVVTNNVLLNGELRLVSPSQNSTAQLIQTHKSASLVSGTGKLLVDQNSTVPSKYRYNYLSSPVKNSAESTTYSVGSILKDGTTLTNHSGTVGVNIAKDINFVGGYDGNTTNPISIADHWIWTYAAFSGGRSNWTQKYKGGAIPNTDGFIFKGPGRPQNYTYTGVPKDGNLTTSVGKDESYLVGNPYASAISVKEFIEDNNSSISGVLYFWEHAGEEESSDGTIKGHVFAGYVGGYATRTIATGVSARAAAVSGGVDLNLEAEAASINGVLQQVSDDGNTVNTVQFNSTQNFVKFSNISRGADTLRIRYKSSTDKDIIIKINNRLSGEYTLPATGNSFSLFTIEQCVETSNEILIESNDSNTVYLDYLNLFDEDGYLTCAPNVGGDDITYTEPEPYIAIGQGFFIQGDNVDGGTVVFNNSQREYKTEGTGTSVFFKSNSKSASKSNDKNSILSLPVIKLGMDFDGTDGNNYHRQIAVSFSEFNSFAYDKGYDAEIYDVGDTDMYLKFPEDDRKFVIAGVQQISSDLEVPLEIIMGYSGDVIIKVDEMKNVSGKVFIKDKLNGTSYPILGDKAKLNLVKGTYTDRFVVAFEPSEPALSVDTIEDNLVSIYADNVNSNLVISKKEDVTVSKVLLYDILGKQISNWDIKTQELEMRLKLQKQLPSGFYIVKLKTEKGNISKKIFLE